MAKNNTSGSYTKYTDNVMKPINWVVGVVEVLLILGALQSTTFWIQVTSFVLMTVIMTVYFAIYIYWMLRDPNRLQSEGYNLEVMSTLSDSSDAKLAIDNKKSTIKISERL